MKDMNVYHVPNSNICLVNQPTKSGRFGLGPTRSLIQTYDEVRIGIYESPEIEIKHRIYKRQGSDIHQQRFMADSNQNVYFVGIENISEKIYLFKVANVRNQKDPENRKIEIGEISIEHWGFMNVFSAKKREGVPVLFYKDDGLQNSRRLDTFENVCGRVFPEYLEFTQNRDGSYLVIKEKEAEKIIDEFSFHFNTGKDVDRSAISKQILDLEKIAKEGNSVKGLFDIDNNLVKIIEKTKK